MRYCTNCGSPLENGRFCTNCGTDNGPEPQTVSAISAMKMNINIVKILNWVTVVLFVISAIIMLKQCLSSAKNVSVLAMLYQGSFIPTLVFFVIGMWSCIPALLAILNVNKPNGMKMVVLSVVLVAVMIVVCILNAVFKRTTGAMRAFAVIFATYKNRSGAVITLSVIAALVAAVQVRFEKEGK